MSDEKNWVNEWVEKETEHTRTALENASRHFNDDDIFDVHTLEAIYGKESSFGKKMKKRGIDGAAGHFHLEKATAERFGLTVSEKNDQRFDIDDSSWAAAKYLKTLDAVFSRGKVLYEGLSATVVADVNERKKFTLAAYNGGEGRIAKAQLLALENSKNPVDWNHVKEFLKAAGAEEGKDVEIIEYVDKVLVYEAEFIEKSSADKSAKDKEPLALGEVQGNCRWKTIDGRPVCIED